MEDLQKGRRILVSAVVEAEIKSVTQNVPDKGIFRPVSWAMKYCGTDHSGRLYTQYSQEHGCAIRASILPHGTDRELSNYVFFGTKQECLQWLEDPAHVEALIAVYDHLAEAADKL